MTVFKADYAAGYDALYAAKDYRLECDMIEEAFRRSDSRPGALLDIGCGTGGHAFELARRGYRVTGVDLSPDMLAVASRKAAALDASVRPAFVCGDSRTFDADGPFDAAIMMFAVVGYLTSNADVLAALRNIRRHLRPGAPFISDFWYGPAVLSERPSDRVKLIETPDRRILRTSSTTLDSLAHTADVHFRVWAIDNSSVVSETTEVHRMRYFFPQEYALFLEQAGFELRSLTAFPSLDAPLNESAWNATAVAVAAGGNP